jgi:hypothetical protein
VKPKAPPFREIEASAAKASLERPARADEVIE